MAEPEFMMTDFAKFDRPGHLHVGFQAIHAFQKKHNHLPAPWNQVIFHSPCLRRESSIPAAISLIKPICHVTGTIPGYNFEGFSYVKRLT